MNKPIIFRPTLSILAIVVFANIVVISPLVITSPSYVQQGLGAVTQQFTDTMNAYRTWCTDLG